MRGHTVHDRAHGVFANAVVEVAAGEVSGSDRSLTRRPRTGRSAQVCRAAEQARLEGGQQLDDLLGRLP